MGGDLYPDNLALSALVDETMDSVNDVYSILVPYYFEQDADKKRELAEAAKAKDKLPYWLNKFEKRLEENEAKGHKNGFFVGSTLTVADLKMHAAIEFIDMLPAFDQDEVLKPTPKLAALVAQINAMEKIQKYNAMFKEQLAKTAADPNDSVHVIEGRNEYFKMTEQKEESVSMTITYFNMRGRADPLRMAAFINGVSYKDVFVTCRYSVLLIDIIIDVTHCIILSQYMQSPNTVRTKQQD